MRPPTVGIETNPRSHLAPDSFFFPTLSVSLYDHGAVGVGGGEGIVCFLPLIMRPVGGRGEGGRTVKEGRGSRLAGWLVG